MVQIMRTAVEHVLQLAAHDAGEMARVRHLVMEMLRDVVYGPTTSICRLTAAFSAALC